MQLRYILPLAVFIGLILVFLFGLRIDPSRVPSPLINKPLPQFSLSRLHAADAEISNETLKGRVSLLNVWASWCVSCLHEHPVLMTESRKNNLALYGLNYKDTRENALTWLEKHGNPYQMSAFDPAGRTGIDFGVYGVPETYVLDQHGIVKYKHIGPLTQEDMDTIIKPLIRKLRDGEDVPG